jgi:hypothetical protein
MSVRGLAAATQRMALMSLVALSSDAATAAEPAPALPPLVDAQGQASQAWHFVGFPKQKADLPPTVFEAGQVDGQAGLKVTTDASYGTWVTPWSGPTPALLQWRWRVDLPLSGGTHPPDLHTKAGDDAALKVCVMFDHPLDRVPFFERTLLRVARSVSGENLPAATVCYVWDSGAPAPLEGVNPYTRRMRFISLQGRNAPLTRWIDESRDVAMDFARLYADELPQGAQTPRAELPRVTSVLIGADSDNTSSRSTAWVANLRWAP